MAELASLLAAGLFLLGMGGSMLKNAATQQTRIYTPDESAFPNAQIGYAPIRMISVVTVCRSATS